MSAISPRKRHFHLLPVVVLLGAGLLVIKTSDLINGALAQPGDNATPTLNAEPVPANKDYAGDESDQLSSASQVDVLNSLSKRRRELDMRKSQLDTQANMLAAAEKRVDAKIDELKQLKNEITQLLGARDAAEQNQIAAVIKSYGPDGMRPAKAAMIFNNLPDEVLIPVAQGMKPDDLGQILSYMNPDAAQKLTLKLVNRLTLPQTFDALSPAGAASSAQPGQGGANSSDSKAEKPQSSAADNATAQAKSTSPKNQ